MTSKKAKEKKGFTLAEKWVIWGVLCLLVGLSTHRFSVFFGLMFLSGGISLVIKKQKLILALLLCILGILALVFSRPLI